jgi:hypothetical protein
MITIKIFGTTPPCAKCTRAEREAQKAAGRFLGRVEVRKLDALGPEADAYGLLVTPTVVVNDVVVSSGRVMPARDLERHIREALEEA